MGPRKIRAVRIQGTHKDENIRKRLSLLLLLLYGPSAYAADAAQP
jgi:hypothetical protein